MVVPGGVWTTRCRSGSGRSGARAPRRASAWTAAGREQLERVAGGRGARPELGRELVADHGEVEALVGDREPAGIHPREIEQVGRELRQPRRPGRASRSGTPPASRRRAPRRCRAARGSPASEKSGVRSSCEALAMNSPRARSSEASRSRICSKARASWPSSSGAVSDDRLVEAARRRSAPPRPRAAGSGARRASRARSRARSRRPWPRSTASSTRRRTTATEVELVVKRRRDEAARSPAPDGRRGLGVGPSRRGSTAAAHDVRASARPGERAGRARCRREVPPFESATGSTSGGALKIATLGAAGRPAAPRPRSSCRSGRPRRARCCGRAAIRPSVVAHVRELSVRRASSGTRRRRSGRRSRAHHRRRRGAQAQVALRRCGAGSPVAEAVPDAAHGEDELRVPRVPLELLPQMPHVDVDRARIAELGASPERLEQHPAARRRARAGRRAGRGARTRRR